MKNNPTSNYDTATIRQLLSESFNDEELVVFCFDHFPTVHKNFSAAMSLLLKIQYLMDYCQRYGQFDTLLQLMAEKNPFQFALNQPYKKSEQPSMTVAFKVKGELASLTYEQRQALSTSFQNVLAHFLDVSSDKIEVVAMRPGSIILEIGLPSEAAVRLEKMMADEAWLERLGILEFWGRRPLPTSKELMREQIRQIIDLLDESEQEVLIMRFGLNDGIEHSLEEVGRHFNITRERIRQIEVKALRKLRHPSRQQQEQDLPD